MGHSLRYGFGGHLRIEVTCVMSCSFFLVPTIGHGYSAQTYYRSVAFQVQITASSMETFLYPGDYKWMILALLMWHFLLLLETQQQPIASYGIPSCNILHHSMQVVIGCWHSNCMCLKITLQQNMQNSLGIYARACNIARKEPIERISLQDRLALV